MKKLLTVIILTTLITACDQTASENNLSGGMYDVVDDPALVDYLVGSWKCSEFKGNLVDFEFILTFEKERKSIKTTAPLFDPHNPSWRNDFRIIDRKIYIEEDGEEELRYTIIDISKDSEMKIYEHDGSEKYTATFDRL